MAKVIIDNVEYEVKDGEQICNAALDAGVPFNCNSGECGTCLVKVLEGADNMGELTDEEVNLGMDKDNRLSCVSKVKSGIVKLKY